MEKINIGICGLGTVGAGVVSVLQRNEKLVTARTGRQVVVRHVGARRDNPNCPLDKIRVSRDIFAVADDPEVDILLELIGGCDAARELVLRAIRNGKHIVTANKALIAVHGEELFAEAAAHGVSIGFEAAVGGGIPVIKALREGLAANRIRWLAGIINGTGNFILSEMQNRQRDFAAVLADAQARGYAEADPTFDIEGIDAAHKLVILASIAFGIPLYFEQCYTQGISAIDSQDIEFAAELGYRIKQLGIARKTDHGYELRVHPTLIPRRRLIANVDGVMNAVLINGDAAGSTMYYGAGAGAEPTASAVIADIIDIVRALAVDASSGVPSLGTHDVIDGAIILPIEAVRTAYYLRMTVRDKPGVLTRVTQIFAEAEISLEAVKQPEAPDGAETVSLILLTDVTVERAMMDVLRRLESLPDIIGKATFIRLESLD